MSRIGFGGSKASRIGDSASASHSRFISHLHMHKISFEDKRSMMSMKGHLHGHHFKNMCKNVSFAISLNPDAEAQAARVAETHHHRKENNDDEDDDNNGVCVDGHGGVRNGGDHTRHGMNDNGTCKSSFNVRGF